LLKDGTVLMTGGENNSGVTQFNAELYSPTTQTQTFALANA
jgi:hypothetical protein